MGSDRIYYPINVTPEQRANLELLWARAPATAESQPFSMLAFFSRKATSAWDAAALRPGEIDEPDCGAVACLAGRAPLCGIPAADTDEGWHAYIRRALGCKSGMYAEGDALWQWVFAADWAARDNTLAGALARLRIALDAGVPSDWLSQRQGSVPLEYAT